MVVVGWVLLVVVWYGMVVGVPHPGAIAMQGACVLQHPSWLTKVGGRREVGGGWEEGGEAKQGIPQVNVDY